MSRGTLKRLPTESRYDRAGSRSPNPSVRRPVLDGVPILMYHAIGARLERASRYIIPAQRFEAQMAWLEQSGHSVISLGDLVHYLRNGQTIPSRAVVITADDGYSDFKVHAWPVLRTRGFPATVFLVSGRVGDVNRWDEKGELAGRALLSWDEISEMRGSGVEFAAHTHTHPDLTAIPSQDVLSEFQTSRAVLQERLGEEIRLLSYPHGRHNPAIATLAEQAGFWGSCTVVSGMNTSTTPLFSLRRVEVYGTDSMLQFAIAVRFGARPPALLRQLLHSIAPGLVPATPLGQ